MARSGGVLAHLNYNWVLARLPGGGWGVRRYLVVEPGTISVAVWAQAQGVCVSPFLPPRGWGRGLFPGSMLLWGAVPSQSRRGPRLPDGGARTLSVPVMRKQYMKATIGFKLWGASKPWGVPLPQTIRAGLGSDASPEPRATLQFGGDQKPFDLRPRRHSTPLEQRLGCESKGFWRVCNRIPAGAPRGEVFGRTPMHFSSADRFRPNSIPRSAP